MKKGMLIGLVVVLLVTAISCGGGASKGSATGESVNRLQTIIDRGVLRAGVALNGPPIGGRDDKGQPYGYDVDFAQKFADTLGVKLEITDVDGETRIPALTSGRVDIVFANITGNLERAKSVDFSIPYLHCGIKMMVNKGSSFKTVEDLDKPGVKVAVARGTTGEDLVLKYAPNAEIVYVTNFTDQTLLMKQGKADATFEDSTLIDFTAGQSNGELIALPHLYTSDPICIGLPKGDLEYVRYVDMFVSWMISSGWQSETYYKWWGTEPSAEYTSLW
ncbi:MAG: transporter substrate-binding domain-containing protein [Sphaerochaetaceae bacterium]|jgi:polar amino acid transport system substrate-binding protein|nr:transporter substrate-binding domain-containing protein [Sphaerochaetaceae bacterium]